MTLTVEDYEVLYDEVTVLNEENVQGKFFVSDVEELKEQAINFLKEEHDYEDEDFEDFHIDNIRWRGSGLYCFWGLGFTSGYTLANVVEIFEAETDVNHLILLSDQETIEKEKEVFRNLFSNYVYIVWEINPFKRTFSIAFIVESDEPLNVSEVYMKLGDDGDVQRGNGHWWNNEVEEISDMVPKTIYEFLKQYNKLYLI